ncbi:MAG: hypothetical protein COA52_15945 [Hyphomicrobiales bacterium]|nr:MAG: hypothetical protein COA52_15945 [Hyphomicrobiales bacterium]
MSGKKTKPRLVKLGCVDCTVRVIDENDTPLTGYQARIAQHDVGAITNTVAVPATANGHTFHVRQAKWPSTIQLTKGTAFASSTKIDLNQNSVTVFKILRCDNLDIRTEE